MLVIGLVLVVGVAGAGAAGLEGAAITLADDTSVLARLNVPHGELKEAVAAGGLAEPGGLIDGPGVRVQYFDHDLFLLLPVAERVEAEVEGQVFRAVSVLVLFGKPDGFDRRWPLVNPVDPGVYHVVARERFGRRTGFLVTAGRPHRVTAMQTRLPESGSVPGAMVGQAEVHPYGTQIGRGCVFGVGLVVGGRIVTCDLVR